MLVTSSKRQPDRTPPPPSHFIFFWEAEPRSTRRLSWQAEAMVVVLTNVLSNGFCWVGSMLMDKRVTKASLLPGVAQTLAAPA